MLPLNAFLQLLLFYYSFRFHHMTWSTSQGTLEGRTHSSSRFCCCRATLSNTYWVPPQPLHILHQQGFLSDTVIKLTPKKKKKKSGRSRDTLRKDCLWDFGLVESFITGDQIQCQINILVDPDLAFKEGLKVLWSRGLRQPLTLPPGPLCVPPAGWPALAGHGRPWGYQPLSRQWIMA